VAAGKRVLGMRYRLLPYLYSALHDAHATGAPVMRPLWMNFPRDGATHTLDRCSSCGCGGLALKCLRLLHTVVHCCRVLVIC
jgi:hypothetical protein